MARAISKTVSRTEKQKSGLVKMISIGRGQLQWDDSFYKEMKLEHGGHDSLTKMSIAELEQLKKHMIVCGADLKAKPTHRRRVAIPEDREGKIQKIYKQLENIGKPEKYAEGILRNQRGMKNKNAICPLNMATEEELVKIIRSLDTYAKRHGVRRK